MADRLPKLGERVLVSIEGDGFKVRTIGVWTGKEWRRAGLEKLPYGAEKASWPIEGKITHWQRLPESPR